MCYCLPAAFVQPICQLFGPYHMTAQTRTQINFWWGRQRRYFPSPRKANVSGEKYPTDDAGRRSGREGPPCQRRRRRFCPILLFLPICAPPLLHPVPSSRSQLPIFVSFEVWLCFGLLGYNQFGCWLLFLSVSDWDDGGAKYSCIIGSLLMEYLLML